MSAVNDQAWLRAALEPLLAVLWEFSSHVALGALLGALARLGDSWAAAELRELSTHVSAEFAAELERAEQAALSRELRSLLRDLEPDDEPASGWELLMPDDAERAAAALQALIDELERVTPP